jgi:hypothetical protein
VKRFRERGICADCWCCPLALDAPRLHVKCGHVHMTEAIYTRLNAFL